MNVSRLAILSVASFSFLAVAACGKPSGKTDGTGTATVTSANAPKGGSCMEEKSGICTEYSDNPLGFAEAACKDMYKGTYQKTSCPTDKLIGTCQRKSEKDGKPGDKEFYYFGNGKAAWTDDAKEDCEKNPLLPGTFSAQAGNEQAAKDNAIPKPDHISASCQKKDGTCEDITGRLGELEKSFCEDGGNGTYNDGKTCATENLVGSCVKHGKVERHYTANLKGTSMKSLQKDCEDLSILGKNHWYPGPAAPAAGAPAAKAAAPAAKPKTGGSTKAKNK
jgi:hypothetical protein